MLNLRGKTAVVTGGTRGIGKAVCEAFAGAGCNVVATGTQAVDKPGARIKYLKLNLLDDGSIASFLGELSKLKQIDILVNNAGINILESIDRIEDTSWENILKVNLTGPMRISRAVAAIMMKKKNSGRILNVSSIWGIKSKEKRNAYSASKTGLIGLTRAMALDLAPFNILVNALCPGFTSTELTKSMLTKPEMLKLARQVPLGRFATPGEIANTALFLCSAMNTYITGQSIVVDGGFVIR